MPRFQKQQIAGQKSIALSLHISVSLQPRNNTWNRCEPGPQPTAPYSLATPGCRGRRARGPWSGGRPSRRSPWPSSCRSRRRSPGSPCRSHLPGGTRWLGRGKRQLRKNFTRRGSQPRWWQTLPFLVAQTIKRTYPLGKIHQFLIPHLFGALSSKL